MELAIILIWGLINLLIFYCYCCRQPFFLSIDVGEERAKRIKTFLDIDREHSRHRNRQRQ